MSDEKNPARKTPRKKIKVGSSNNKNTQYISKSTPVQKSKKEVKF